MSLVPFVRLDGDLERAAAGLTVPLSAREQHHLDRVLRLRPGAAVEVSDGRGRTAAAQLEATGVRLRSAPVEHRRRVPRIGVAQALPKGRKLDEVVRQVTELGADLLVPVMAERCVTRPTDGRGVRLRERAEAVARAAAEQARSPWPTVITEVTAVETFAGGVAELMGDPEVVVLIAHPGATSLSQVLLTARKPSSVVVVVGPEGGWTDEEMTAFLAAEALPVGLGPTVLRAEHAAAAAVAVVAASTGRWD